jgi:aspartyl-tRNA(Asn)/glutamyl-tRNA(Gln) amidotransferase subunit A
MSTVLESETATNAVVTPIDPPLPHAPEGPLAGVRVGLKDNIDTAGVRTTCGSAYFADRVPDSDAEVVSRLAAAGALMVAKLNLSEFAIGLTSQNSASGPVRNPWDLSRVPGGSSGGSAAAVAAGLVEVALGTDTGGSVRVPAAACGVTGLRPGISVVPDAGTFPVCELVDTVGPIARDVELVARVFAVLAGRDARELEPAPPRRIGVPELWFDDLDPEVAALVAAAGRLPHRLRADTYQTMIGLLAATGMRGGEVIALDLDDVDRQQRVLVVRKGKFGKAREVALHDSTLAALEGYLERRRRLCPRPKTSAVFPSGRALACATAT